LADSVAGVRQFGAELVKDGLHQEEDAKSGQRDSKCCGQI